MKSCVIYSNCQADGLALFLKAMRFPYQITIYRNYQMILGEQKISDLISDARTADLLIYQPTNEKHGESSSHNILKALKPGCRSISFAYVYNHGMHPLTEHGTKWPGAEFINPEYWQMTLPKILALYDAGEFDFALWPRFLHCLGEQATREATTDIKLTRWMANPINFERRLLLNVNHPTSYLFIEMAEQVMRLLDIQPNLHDLPVPTDAPSAENLANLPCTVPFSEYVRKEFSSYRKTDPEAHNFYRAYLQKLWRFNQDTHTQP